MRACARARIGVQRVLDRRRHVSGEDAQQLLVARRVRAARAPVGQLQDAADRFAHDDRHADQRTHSSGVGRRPEQRVVRFQVVGLRRAPVE
jgi:hypothetical protein